MEKLQVVRRFLRLLLKHFLANRGLQSAAALTYTTLFAVVPIMTVTFVVLTAIPSFKELSGVIQGFVLRHLLPDAGAQVLSYLSCGGTSVILLAREQGGLVGTAMVGFDGHRGWVYYLGVREERRGKGIARMLMGACEDWLVARGSPKIQLMVRGDNQAALGFYAALGYARQDVVTLGKRLDG